jgi:hypothetical protein
MSRPLQIYLDDAEMQRLEDFASARGWTKSQTIRAAIRALTQPPDVDPVLELSGDLDGLPPDLSERFHHYLDETYVAETQGRYRKKPSGR